MNTEVRCYKCSRQLGTTDSDDFKAIVFPMAVQAAEGQLLFTIKCPRCGSHNHVKFTK